MNLFPQQLIFKIIIPAILLLFCALITFNFLDTTSLSFSNLEYRFSKSNFLTWQDTRLLKGQKVSASFVSPNNYLGIIAVRFNTFGVVNKDSVYFRIKENGQKNWYATNTYTVGQFQNNQLFTFGFPIIENSKGKKYVFEVESVKGKKDNSVALSSAEPVFVTRHNYSVFLHSNKKNLLQFILYKVTNLILQTNFLPTILVSSLPFLIYIFLYSQKKKIPFFKKIRKKHQNIFTRIDMFFLLHKNKGFPELDGIRGWAILLVLLVHVGPYVSGMPGSSHTSHIAYSMSTVFEKVFAYFPIFGWQGGGMGVDIFFMLSGFLMYMTIFKKSPGFFTFLLKRGKRLLPAHIAVIFVGFAGLPLLVIFLNIFFLVNFFPRLTNINVVTWTLNYELVFYLICGFWFILAKKNKLVQSWIFFFVLTLLIYISPLFLYVPFAKINIQYFDTSRFIAFFFGAGLGKLFLSETRMWKKMQKYFVVLAIPATACVLFLKYPLFMTLLEKIIAPFWSSAVFYLLLDICLFIVLGSLLAKKTHVVKKIFANRSLRIFGAISYSLYLINYNWGVPMSLGIVKGIESAPIRQVTFVIVAVLSNFLIAAFLFHFLEKPYFTQKGKKT